MAEKNPSASASVSSLPVKEPLGASASNSSSSIRSYSHADQGGVFANDTSLRNFYKPIDSYEGAHRYDPTAQWTEGEEKRIVRKIDYRVASWCCLMFFALQLDRGNISQALSDNMLDDLGLTTDQYNWGQTVFYTSFLVAELPSQLVSKKLGPDRWIPIQMCAWSIVAGCQSRLNGYASFVVCRCLIGLIEGGCVMFSFYDPPFSTGTIPGTSLMILVGCTVLSPMLFSTFPTSTKPKSYQHGSPGSGRPIWPRRLYPHSSPSGFCDCAACTAWKGGAGSFFWWAPSPSLNATI
jgi:hypothetical protein